MKTFLFPKILISLLIVITLPLPLLAASAGDLTDVQIIGHHFAANVSGLLSEDSTGTQKINDPFLGRLLVLVVKAKAPDNTSLFTTDFVLNYQLDGKEGREQCLGISLVSARDKIPYRFLLFNNSNYPRLTPKENNIYFGLLFVLSNDVQNFTLRRTGSASEVVYNLGPKRTYSVLLNTNSFNQSELTEIKQALEKAGYSVHLATELNPQTEGVTIHYFSKVELIAREISQRLIIMDLVADLREVDGISSYDVIIWLGKNCKKKIHL